MPYGQWRPFRAPWEGEDLPPAALTMFACRRLRMCRPSGECNDGVPPLGLVTLCIIRPFPRYSIRRRTAVSHAVNGGDAVVTTSTLQCPTAKPSYMPSTAGRRRHTRQQDAIVTLQDADAPPHVAGGDAIVTFCLKPQKYQTVIGFYC